MNIPFLSFTSRNETVKQEYLQEFMDFFDSQRYVLGNKTLLFEKKFAEFCNVTHSIGVSNGLDALILALRALGIKGGDEVIVPSNTYIASVLAITAVGAKPVFVEPKIDTYNMDPILLESLINKKTKAILPVHLYGQACEMTQIMSIADKYNLFVVEDNAQSHGAFYDGKPTGSFGILNATSFYPTKNLGALGEAGAITTNNDGLADKIKMLRNYGSKTRYYNQIEGYNCRIDEFEAACLNINLKYIEKWNLERIKTAEHYISILEQIEDLVLPKVAPGSTSVFHLFVIRTNKRNDLQIFLKENGIETVIHYPIPPHLQECYSYLGYEKGDFPIAEQIADSCLSLPNFIGIKNEEVTFICEKIIEFFKVE